MCWLIDLYLFLSLFSYVFRTKPIGFESFNGFFYWASLDGLLGFNLVWFSNWISHVFGIFFKMWASWILFGVWFWMDLVWDVGWLGLSLEVGWWGSSWAAFSNGIWPLGSNSTTAQVRGCLDEGCFEWYNPKLITHHPKLVGPTKKFCLDSITWFWSSYFGDSITQKTEWWSLKKKKKKTDFSCFQIWSSMI